MHKNFLSVLAVFALLFSFCSAQPKIEIMGGTDTFDWKTVTPKEDPLKANVTIKNVGTDTLKITEIKPGCGCTSAKLEEIKSSLLPGESTILPVTLRIGTAHNDLIKTVRISSNDPNAKDKQLFLKAKVFHPIDVNPSIFQFSEMKVGTEYKSSIKVKNNTDKNITLSDFQMNPESVSISVKGTKIVQPGEEIEITAFAKPEKAGYFSCTLKFKTTSADYPEISVSGYGNVKESAIFNSVDPAKK